VQRAIAPPALLAAGAVAFAAGCGGGEPPTRAEYQESVVATRDDVDAALASITQASSKDDLLERMESAGARIEREADELGDTTPADGFEDENDELEDALHQLAVDLTTTADQIRRPDVGLEDLMAGARGLSFESWTQADRVLARLRQQGVRVPPLARH
jgi:hypothetical protein